MGEKKKELRSLVESSDDLPALPQIWLRVRKITEDLRASAQNVAEVILKDQAMTARVLKAANSAIYAGYHQKITTITNAIVLLGFKEVRNIILGYAAYNMLHRLRKKSHFDFQSFWVHSLATGVASRMISESMNYELPEEAFVAGLLHDIGKLIAAHLRPDEYDLVLHRVIKGENILVVEKNILGANHQEIGEWAARRWSFPDVLIDVISLHHRSGLRDNERSQHPLADMVAIGDEMAKLIFKTGNGLTTINPKQLQEKAYDLLNLSRERWAIIIRELATNVRKLVDEFHLRPEDVEAYTAYLEESNLEHIRTEKFYEDMNRELTEKVKELHILHEFSAALLQTIDTREIQKLLLESIFRAIHFSRILLFLPNKPRTRLSAMVGYGADSQHLIKKASLNLEEKGAIVSSFLDGKIVNILNAASHLYAESVSQEELDMLCCASFACIPIKVYNQSLGVVVVDNHIPSEPISDQRLNAVATFVNQASLGLQRQGLKN